MVGDESAHKPSNQQWHCRLEVELKRQACFAPLLTEAECILRGQTQPALGDT